MLALKKTSTIHQYQAKRNGRVSLDSRHSHTYITARGLLKSPIMPRGRPPPPPQLIQNSRIKPLPLTAITANCRLSRGFLRKCSAQVCNLEPCQVMIRHLTLFLIGYLAKCACNRFKIGITECRSLVRRACQTAEQCLHCKTEHTLVFV